jgi:hypothetical protein
MLLTWGMIIFAKAGGYLINLLHENRLPIHMNPTPEQIMNKRNIIVYIYIYIYRYKMLFILTEVFSQAITMVSIKLILSYPYDNLIIFPMFIRLHKYSLKFIQYIYDRNPTLNDMLLCDWIMKMRYGFIVELIFVVCNLPVSLTVYFVLPSSSFNRIHFWVK